MILQEILESKREEVRLAMKAAPQSVLESRVASSSKPRQFSSALRNPKNRLGLIAEMKKASPSAGVLRQEFDPSALAAAYQSAGADCISVLTDSKYFLGSLDHLAQAKAASTLPVLRKDFVVSEYQIVEARAAGADCILLIVAALDPDELGRFHVLASRLGMSVLVEVHTQQELSIANAIGASLIGINSRDLNTFRTDLAVVERLAKLSPTDALIVAESGIKTAADVRRMADAGVSALLVGETLMRSSSIGLAVAELFETAS